jgi:hypothetical protein
LTMSDMLIGLAALVPITAAASPSFQSHRPQTLATQREISIGDSAMRLTECKPANNAHPWLCRPRVALSEAITSPCRYE